MSPRSLPARRRKSPSQIRRDQRRKELFIAKKTAASVDTTEETIEDSAGKDAEKPDEYFYCELCDFKSNWNTGVTIHMTRKHHNLEQLDGIVEDLEEDEKYLSTQHYWKEGRIGTVYQTFLDVNDIKECLIHSVVI